MKADDPRAPSVQIADDLRSRIEGGEFAPGAKLPSIRELASQYGVAPMTAQGRCSGYAKSCGCTPVGVATLSANLIARQVSPNGSERLRRKCANCGPALRLWSLLNDCSCHVSIRRGERLKSQ